MALIGAWQADTNRTLANLLDLDDVAGSAKRAWSPEL